jgi:hypothetical protein
MRQPRFRLRCLIATLSICASTATAHSSPLGWSETFPGLATVFGLGSYAGDQNWTFGSFSFLTLMASPTSVFSVAGGHVVMADSEPGLQPNPTPPPFFVPGLGSVSNRGWVDVTFDDVRMTGRVNVASPSQGSNTSQGLMARWDYSNNFYWFHIDFSSGQFGILKQSVLGSGVILPNSLGQIAGFDNRAAYRLTFELIGNTLQGSVFDDQGLLVGATPLLLDLDPHLRGVSGVLNELALSGAFEPLQGSFDDVTADVIPEPATGLLLACGLAAMIYARTNPLRQARRTS